MQPISFDAWVVNGQLEPAEAIRAFEGRQVRITVLPPPPDIDVEKDIYVPPPLRKAVVANPVITEGKRVPPCLVLPEDLPDE